MKKPAWEAEKDDQVCGMINSSSVPGTVGFFSLMGAVGFAEENMPACLVMCAVFAACAYLAAREYGGKG